MQDVVDCVVDLCYWDGVCFCGGQCVDVQVFLVVGCYCYVEVCVEGCGVVGCGVVGDLCMVVLVVDDEVVKVYLIFQYIGQQCVVVVYFLVVLV